jgi:hypothetical protein
MVEKVSKGYICIECNMIYKIKSLAEKCEAYCKKFKSCNTNIIKKAIKK